MEMQTLVWTHPKHERFLFFFPPSLLYVSEEVETPFFPPEKENASG